MYFSPKENQCGIVIYENHVLAKVFYWYITGKSFKTSLLNNLPIESIFLTKQKIWVKMFKHHHLQSYLCQASASIAQDSILSPCREDVDINEEIQKGADTEDADEELNA